MPDHDALSHYSHSEKAQGDLSRPIIGTLDELTPALHAQGFTHARTLAGPIPLEHFNPYGIRHADRFGQQWRGTLITVEGKPYLADAREPEPPFLRGMFPLLTEDEATTAYALMLGDRL